MQPWRCQASTLSLSPILVLHWASGLACVKGQTDEQWMNASVSGSQVIFSGIFSQLCHFFSLFFLPSLLSYFSSQDKHLLRHFEIPKANFETVSCRPKSCPWVPIISFPRWQLQVTLLNSLNLRSSSPQLIGGIIEKRQWWRILSSGRWCLCVTCFVLGFQKQLGKFQEETDGEMKELIKHWVWGQLHEAL